MGPSKGWPKSEKVGRGGEVKIRFEDGPASHVDDYVRTANLIVASGDRANDVQPSPRHAHELLPRFLLDPPPTFVRLARSSPALGRRARSVWRVVSTSTRRRVPAAARGGTRRPASRRCGSNG